MLLEGKKVLVMGASDGHITGQIIEMAGGMEGRVIHEL